MVKGDVFAVNLCDDDDDGNEDDQRIEAE